MEKIHENIHVLCLHVIKVHTHTHTHTVFCIALGSRNKRSLRMSYMYGPDVELSNLRDAYRQRQTQAANPHYMWWVFVCVGGGGGNYPFSCSVCIT